MRMQYTAETAAEDTTTSASGTAGANGQPIPKYRQRSGWKAEQGRAWGNVQSARVGDGREFLA